MSETSRRRTPAPDMAGCIMALYGATLAFAVLRAVYSSSHAAEVVAPVLVYGGLVALCGWTAAGLFRRQPWAGTVGVLISLFSLGCALTGFHMSETAQVPAGLLGLLGLGLLLGSRDEFAPASSSSSQQ